MAKLDDLKKFHETIEQNFIEMNDKKLNSYVSLQYNNGEPIYFTSSNELGETYYILKHNFDLEKSKSMYIGCLSIDVLVASQMDNSLDCLGLQKIDGKIVRKKQENQLIKFSCGNTKVIFDNNGYIVNAKGFMYVMWMPLDKDEELIGKHITELAEMIKKYAVNPQHYISFLENVVIKFYENRDAYYSETTVKGKQKMKKYYRNNKL